MITPQRSLRLLGYVALLLVITLYILPTEIKLSDQITLQTFSVQSIFEKKEVQYADISEIQEKFTPADVSAEEEADPGSSTPQKAERKKEAPKEKANTKAKAVQTSAKPDSLEKKYLIQLPDDNPAALKAFFSSLHTLKKSPQLIRVLHYGDSQVEGDRITSFLRMKLQERFGGCGVGLVPLIDPVGGRKSIVQKADKGWKRFITFGNEYNKNVPPHYGVMGSYYTYAARPVSLAASADTIAQSEAFSEASGPVYSSPTIVSVDFYRSQIANRRDRMFDKIKVLYRNNNAPLKLSIFNDKDTLKTARLDSSGQFRMFQYFFREEFKHVKLKFEGTGNPEFFGVALDCNNGVAVDNIAFRGSSGTEFTRMNRDLLQQQIKALNVKCIILQFGVNVVPYEVKDYAFYERQFYAQLNLLKSIAPDVSILVVGVSDMSKKDGENYISYPNVEEIRDAQRRAAFRAGCAFWDLYEAMGGKNSMPSWVMADPPLANKDFTHFTPKGARLVSEMLYKALMTSYEKYNTKL